MLSPALLASAGICIVLTFCQDVIPGKAFYHTSWYALSLVLAGSVLLVRGRSARAALVTAGSLLIAGAGLASGLLGPDTAEFVRAPGSIAPVPELGKLEFPLAESNGEPMVALRTAKRLIFVGHAYAYAGAFILHERLRTIAHVDVFDLRGNHLTITQPQNLAFLSPVLLFQQETTIGGKTLPVDSFTVPAMHRTVKAVLFDRDHIGVMPGPIRKAGAAVLFAVQNEHGILVRSGMNVIPNGSLGTVGGLKIQSRIARYPAIEVDSAPHPLALLLGVLLLGAAPLRNRFRS